MFGMNKNDAMGAMEDLVMMRNIQTGAQARAEAQTLEQQLARQDDLLRRGVQKIDDLQGVITRLQAQLEAANAELLLLQESNSETVAVANGAALALKQAMQEIKELKGEPDSQLEERYRKVRTRSYNSQVNKFLAEGYLKQDPRKNGVSDKRPWFVRDIDNGF